MDRPLTVGQLSWARVSGSFLWSFWSRRNIRAHCVDIVHELTGHWSGKELWVSSAYGSPYLRMIRGRREWHKGGLLLGSIVSIVGRHADILRCNESERLCRALLHIWISNIRRRKKNTVYNEQKDRRGWKVVLHFIEVGASSKPNGMRENSKWAYVI